MAIYEIIRTPGKEKVYPLSEEDTPLKNQDDAKVVLSRLRAEARAAGQPQDFIVRRVNEPSTGGSSTTGTSLRLSEENRRTVAKFCGRMMMETGDPISMGDAVGRLVAIAETAADTGLIGFDGQINEDEIITLAKRLIKERKAAA